MPWAEQLMLGQIRSFLKRITSPLLTISASASPFADITKRRNDKLVQVIASNVSEIAARHGIDSMAQIITRFANVTAEMRRPSRRGQQHDLAYHLNHHEQVNVQEGNINAWCDLEARFARPEYYLHKDNDLKSATRSKTIKSNHTRQQLKNSELLPLLRPAYGPPTP